MKTGFKFKGIHSESFQGLVMKTSSRPVLPEMKNYKYDTPNMDGDYDYSYANVSERAHYKNRLFVLTLQISAKELSELMAEISRIGAWLIGKGVLEFDDMPGVVWYASVINGVDYAPERRGKEAILSVSFDVSPFSECVFDTASGPVLDCKIPLDSELPLDISSVFTFAGNEIEVYNIGSWYCAPTIIYTAPSAAGFSNMVIECRDKALTIGQLSTQVNEIIVDMEKHIVYAKSSGSSQAYNCMKNTYGDFFELFPGKNIINSAGNVSGFTTKVIYTPKFVYGYDYEGGM